MKTDIFCIHKTIKMKKLEKRIGTIRKGIATAGLTGLTALLLSTEACTPAQQKVVAAEVIIEKAKTQEQLMAGYLLKTLGEMEHDIEVAEAGKDEININVGEERNSRPNTTLENVIYSDGEYFPAPGYRFLNNVAGDYSVVKIEDTTMRNEKSRGVFAGMGLYYITDAGEKVLLKKLGEKIIGVPYHVERNKDENVYESIGIMGKDEKLPLPFFFTYNKYVDLNNNKSAEREEFFGLGKKVFDLDREYLLISYLNYFLRKDENALFRSWTDTGELIGETSVRTSGSRSFKSFYTGLNSKYNNPPNFLDKLRINGPGKYMVTLNVPGIEQTFRLDLNIID